MIYLNCIKSKCFMLMVGLALLLGATSCNNEDFEDNVPDQPKELSKAELIESALSRIPQTRGLAPIPVMMVTSKKTVTIRCMTTEDMAIDWGDGSTTPIIKNFYTYYNHTYSDDLPSHGIFIEGSNHTIKRLTVKDNDLTYLDVTNNTELGDLICNDNQLDQLDLTGCQKLLLIHASMNNLSSINITDSPQLTALIVSNNRLTDIDVSKNPKLYSLSVDHNQIISLNLSKNPDLQYLSVGHNLITDLDFSKATLLTSIDLERLAINTINNAPISDTSFAAFSQLVELHIAYTPFTSLDLSSNFLVSTINISGTEITQLDISNQQIRYLYATDSKLTNLIYTPNSLFNAKDLLIRNTPFETLSSKLYPFLTTLPDRNLPDNYGVTWQGRLYTNSSALIAPFLPALTRKNWVVNP